MKYSFGAKLREIRERKGLTLREIAKKIGVSESLISQIERDKVSPAIDTLLGMLDVLEVDIDYIFSDLKKERILHIVRKNERHKIIQGGVRYYQLSRTYNSDEQHSIEAYIIEMEPGAERGSSEYGHPGKELGVIIEGIAEFKIGGKSYILNEGDSISFSSGVPHILKNIGDGVLKAFWVITPPKMIFGG
jgi:transcriptional regulator with XRE-family HTH domain